MAVLFQALICLTKAHSCSLSSNALSATLPSFHKACHFPDLQIFKFFWHSERGSNTSANASTRKSELYCFSQRDRNCIVFPVSQPTLECIAGSNVDSIFYNDFSKAFIFRIDIDGGFRFLYIDKDVLGKLFFKVITPFLFFYNRKKLPIAVCQFFIYLYNKFSIDFRSIF